MKHFIIKHAELGVFQGFESGMLPPTRQDRQLPSRRPMFTAFKRLRRRYGTLLAAQTAIDEVKRRITDEDLSIWEVDDANNETLIQGRGGLSAAENKRLIEQTYNGDDFAEAILGRLRIEAPEDVRGNLQEEAFLALAEIDRLQAFRRAIEQIARIIGEIS